MSKVLTNPDNYTAIANAIRNKGVNGVFKPSEMAAAINSIETGGSANVSPLNITENGVITATDVDGFTPVTTNVWQQGRRNPHVDDNGKWHFPEDWEYNIENITIASGENVAYYLISCLVSDYTFFNTRCYGTGITATIGIMSGNSFVAIDTPVSIANAGYTNFDDLNDYGYDHLVIKIAGTTITQLVNSDQTTGAKLGAQYCPILMRYANLPNANAVCGLKAWTLESDYINNLYANVSSKSLSFSAIYQNNYMLARLRLPNNNIRNQTLTSFANAFAGCNALSDVSDTDDVFDCSGWVGASVSSCVSAFSSCTSLRAINVTGWVMTKVTTIASLFNTCRNLVRVIGLDTWTNCNVMTTATQMFSACWSLRSVDFGNTNLNGNGKLTNTSSMFENCYRMVTADLGKLSMANVTTVASMFASCMSLKSVDMTNITPPSSKLTTCTGLFNNCFCLEANPINGWNFTNATVYTLFNYCYSIKRLEFPNCTPTQKSQADSTSQLFAQYAYFIEYLDLRGILADASYKTGSGFRTAEMTTKYNLVEYYPPSNMANDCSFAGAQHLNHDSLIRILNSLANVSGKTITLGKNVNKLTAEEQAIATEKGWTIA